MKKNSVSVANQLFKHPYRFEFPQAVKILQTMAWKENPSMTLGERDDPKQDPIAFRSYVGFEASSSDIKALTAPVFVKEKTYNTPEMTVTFLGIAGIQGTLPDVFSEMLMDRIRAKDYGFRDFLDLFNHRLITFWYKFYLKLFPTVKGSPLDQTEIGQSLIDLGGVRYAKDESKRLLPFGPLFWQTSKSIIGLETILQGYFNVPCAVTHWYEGWVTVTSKEQTQLGMQYHVLKDSAILGKRALNQSKNFMVTLGPLTYGEFLSFLPIGLERTIIPSGYAALKRIIHTYFQCPQDFIVKLLLKRNEVPPAQLQQTTALGYTAWLNARNNFQTQGIVRIKIEGSS